VVVLAGWDKTVLFTASLLTSTSGADLTELWPDLGRSCPPTRAGIRLGSYTARRLRGIVMWRKARTFLFQGRVTV